MLFFFQRRNTLGEQDVTISPSPTDSECSTLVSLSMNDVHAVTSLLIAVQIDFSTEDVERKEIGDGMYEVR